MIQGLSRVCGDQVGLLLNHSAFLTWDLGLLLSDRFLQLEA